MECLLSEERTLREYLQTHSEQEIQALMSEQQRLRAKFYEQARFLFAEKIGSSDKGRMETMLRHWRLLTINSAKARYIQEAAGAIHGFQLEQKRLRESEYQMAEAERQFESKLKAEREIIDTVKTAWRDRAPNLFRQMNEHRNRLSVNNLFGSWAAEAKRSWKFEHTM